VASNAEAQRRFRERVEFWTGLAPQQWEALPKPLRVSIRAALQEYYAEISEPRSPHGGMYGRIAQIYHGLPWLDWPWREMED